MDYDYLDDQFDGMPKVGKMTNRGWSKVGRRQGTKTELFIFVRNNANSARKQLRALKRKLGDDA